MIMLMAVLFSVWRLESAGWTEGLGLIRNVAVIGFLVGLALGHSQFRKYSVYFLAVAYMVVMITWQLLGAIEYEETQTWLLDKLTILLGRLMTDIQELLAGRAVEDQFFVVALLCLPYWFTSLYSGYHLSREANYLKTILPNGILMIIVHAYHYTSRDYTWMFGIYLFLALILLSRLKYIADRRKWAESRVQVSSESGLDLTNTTIMAAAVLILLAWGTPYILPATAGGREFWRNTYGKLFPPDRFENIFASVNKENQPKPRNFLTELSLGTRTPQSDLVVFRVFTPQSAADIPRLYWRGQVYDRYDEGRWQTTGDKESRREPSSGDINIPDRSHSRRLGFTFDVLVDGQTILYTPAQPVWVNHNAIMLYSEIPGVIDGEDLLLDVMALRASPTIKAGDLYRTSARIGNPTVGELRETDADYPLWVREKYLQLPGDFSPRIVELAKQITVPYDNSFDKALAITNFLRNEIEYSGIVELPDEDVDPLEYFLFESKRGFCNYYATAEVLMLRSVGIPARMAVGYAQGEPNQQNSIYIVRERDLHAWPEVYFSDYGWVEFEPTTSQDPLERPLTREENGPAIAPFINPVDQTPFEEEDEPPAPDLQEEDNAQENPWLKRLTSIFPWLGGVFFILLALSIRNRYAPRFTATNLLRRAIERSGLTPPRWLSRWLVFINRTAIERHFHSINISLRWMKYPQPAHVTAYERAQLLKRLLPDASDSIETLLHELQLQMFTPHNGDEARARQAAQALLYRTIRKRLKIAILGYNYTEVQDIPPYPL